VRGIVGLSADNVRLAGVRFKRTVSQIAALCSEVRKATAWFPYRHLLIVLQPQAPEFETGKDIFELNF